MATPQPDPSRPDCAAFSACLGGQFRVTSPPQGAAGHAAPTGPVELELAEANDLPTKGEGPCKAPFSLVFRGSHDAPLPQGTYPLENQALGTLEVFLVPLGPDGHGLRYQAIFN